MKATEIQIGDWVIHDYYKTPVQIKAIPNAEQIYHPIPLTPEILEKNGFRYNTFDRWMNSRYDVAIAEKDKFLFIWERIQLDYVHELQHALRLCGLNYLADNLKI